MVTGQYQLVLSRPSPLPVPIISRNITHMRIRLLLLCLMMLLAACSGADRTNPRDAEAIFRALLADPIPVGVGELVSTGYIEDSGHNVYLRFTAPVTYLPALLERYNYSRIDCDDEQLRGRITLPQEREDDIPDWLPFVTDDARCYVSAANYSNGWTTAGNSVLVIRPAALTIYFNETG